MFTVLCMIGSENDSYSVVNANYLKSGHAIKRMEAIIESTNVLSSIIHT